MKIQTSHDRNTKCPHVLFYWELNPQSTNETPFIQEVLPVLYVDLIFPIGDRIYIEPDNQSVGQPFISPVLNQSKTISFPVGSRVFGIRISPLFAQKIFGFPLSNLEQKANDMHSVMPRQLYARFIEIVNRDLPFVNRVDAMDQLLCSLLGFENQQLQCVKYCLERLHDPEGCTVRQLATETGYSARWLEKLFQEYLGNTPRQVVSIVRLNKLIELFKSGAQSRMIDLALDAGYYDHSHMIRELKKYANTQPVAFQNEISTFTRIMNHL